MGLLIQLMVSCDYHERVCLLLAFFPFDALAIIFLFVCDIRLCFCVLILINTVDDVLRVSRSTLPYLDQLRVFMKIAHEEEKDEPSEAPQTSTQDYLDSLSS